MLQKLVTSNAMKDTPSMVVSLRALGPVGEELRAAGVDVMALDMPRGVPTARGALMLRKIVTARRPAVIQGWMYHGNLAALVAGRWAARESAVLWSIRQSLYDLSAERWLSRMVIHANARFSGRVSHILYNSRTSRTQHEAFGFSPSNGVFVPNGFETSAFAPNASAREAMRGAWGIPARAVVIGLVARFHPMKDHLGFLVAASRVAQRYPDTWFVLAGAGVDDSNERLRRAVHELGLEARVLLLGVQTDIPAIMASLDILVSSSYTIEAFSNSIGEAMSCGVPCVVTDVGDSADIVSDTGVVVSPRSPNALAEGISRLVASGEEGRSRLGAAARNRVLSHYSLEAVSKTYVRLYQMAAST